MMAVGGISFSIFLSKIVSMLRALLLTIFTLGYFFFFATGTIHAQKNVTIQVNVKGDVTIDRITLLNADLAKEVQQRLWRSYMSNGKMLNTIILHLDDGVSEEIKNEVMSAIKIGQEKTLTVLSLHKYKKRFEDIGTSKQDKIRKNFPVLFQNSYLDKN